MLQSSEVVYPPNSSTNKFEFISRTLITLSPDAISLLDSDCGFIYANPAAVKMFAATGDSELLAYSLEDFVTQSDKVRLHHLIENLKADYRESGPVSCRIVNLAGREVTVEITATSFVHNGKRIIYAMTRDVSATQPLDTKAQASDGTAEENATKPTPEEASSSAEELPIVRRLIAHLADKTLNPLATIDGFLTLFKEGVTEIDIDLLLEELNAVKAAWQPLIDLSQSDFDEAALERQLSSIMRIHQAQTDHAF